MFSFKKNMLCGFVFLAICIVFYGLLRLVYSLFGSNGLIISFAAIVIWLIGFVVGPIFVKDIKELASNLYKNN